MLEIARNLAALGRELLDAAIVATTTPALETGGGRQQTAMHAAGETAPRARHASTTAGRA